MPKGSVMTLASTPPILRPPLLPPTRNPDKTLMFRLLSPCPASDSLLSPASLVITVIGHDCLKKIPEVLEMNLVVPHQNDGPVGDFLKLSQFSAVPTSRVCQLGSKELKLMHVELVHPLQMIQDTLTWEVESLSRSPRERSTPYCVRDLVHFHRITPVMICFKVDSSTVGFETL